MATDAELRAAGLHLPDGDDYMSEGDDAISANARVLYERIEDLPQYRGNLDEQTGTLATLPDGLYRVRYIGTAEQWDLPQPLIGQLEVESAATQREITFRPNDSASGWADKAQWTLATNSNGELRDRWQRLDKAVMRTAPVVLTAPAGEYTQANSRGAVRIPFTVPTGVSRVRVHMRPWNYRTLKTWGPATLHGVMIAQQESEGSGTITGSRWYAPNVDGQVAHGTQGWTSDWFHVGLAEGNTYLLSYAATWMDDVRDLVLGTCWSSFDVDDWDTTDPAVYENGWGGFFLQPMDVWIECEAPGDVPVWGYYGASNTMGMDSGDPVFGAYATLHARRNGAFCALTAAGGWSIMDDTAHDVDIMRRLGYPARIMDRVYLDWGANIAVRGATAQDALPELERWMNRQLNGLGNPDVYLVTQIAGTDVDDTTGTSGTLSEWNQWIRYEGSLRPEVKGVTDFAAIFADPERPWTARPELRAGPTNVHFNAAGQMLRARALDGEIQLPTSAARNPAELSGTTGLRDITASVTADYTSGRVLLRRTENEVTLILDDLVVGNSGTFTLVILDRGFIPFHTERAAWWRPNSASSDNSGTVNITVSGYAVGYLLEPGQPMTARIQFDTLQPWPSTLPGDPA